MVYAIPIAIVLLFSFVKECRSKRVVFYLLCGYLIIISGIRYYVGTDYGIQINYYNWTITHRADFLEPGFRTYINFIEEVFHSINAFFFLAAVFVTVAFGFGMIKFVKKEYRVISLALYILTTVFFATLNIERQYIAIGFLIYSVYFLVNKRYIPTMIMFLFAISFHQSAWCFGVAYILYFCMMRCNEEKLIKFMHIAFSFSLIWVLVDFRPIVTKLSFMLPLGKYMGYLNSRFFMTREMDSALKCIIPSVIWLVIANKYSFIKEKNKYVAFFFPCFFIYTIINNIFYGINVFFRVNLYFEWSIIFLFPLLIELGKDKISRFSIKVMLLGYYFALTVYAIFINNGHDVLPYQTIFG